MRVHYVAVLVDFDAPSNTHLVYDGFNLTTGRLETLARVQREAFRRESMRHGSAEMHFLPIAEAQLLYPDLEIEDFAPPYLYTV